MKRLLTITTALILLASCKKANVSKPINQFNYAEKIHSINGASRIGFLVNFDYYMTGTYTLTATVNGYPYININTFQTGYSVYIPTNFTENDRITDIKIAITSPSYTVTD